MSGVVDTIMRDRGFGFIRDSEKQRTHFFHARDVENSAWGDVQVGDKVEFEQVTSGQKGNGLRAEKVRVLRETHQRRS